MKYIKKEISEHIWVIMDLTNKKLCKQTNETT